MNYKYNKNAQVFNKPLVIKTCLGHINPKFDSELGSCKWLKGNPVKIGGYSRSCEFIAEKQLMQKKSTEAIWEGCILKNKPEDLPSLKNQQLSGKKQGL